MAVYDHCILEPLSEVQSSRDASNAAVSGMHQKRQPRPASKQDVTMEQT